jgi:MFS family permease
MTTAEPEAARRNILVLAVSQALGMAAAPIVILVGGLAGAELAPRPALTTLPIATLVVGAAISSIPAAMLMRRVGRRAGFASGALAGAAAAALAAFALLAQSFALFCLATLLIGANAAFVQQYRFAAAESAGPDKAAKAVSAVMLGGVAAGFLGPEIARLTRNLLPADYAGSFLALAGVNIGLAALLLLLRGLAPAPATQTNRRDRQLRALARQPAFILAASCGVVAYAVMSFVMTATPVSMRVIDQHSVDHAANVIQAHILAMFTPALFTGFLVDRLGYRRMMTIGAIAMLTALIVAPTSHHVSTYTASLALIGIGWNFLFIGSTVLLARTYQAADRFSAQAANDFLVLAAQATAALSAGAAITRFGWEAVNRIALPPVLAVIALLLLIRIPKSHNPSRP